MRAGNGPLEERGRAIRGALAAMGTELAPRGTPCGVNGCTGACHVLRIDGLCVAICGRCKAAMGPRGGMRLAVVAALFDYATAMDDPQRADER